MSRLGGWYSPAVSRLGEHHRHPITIGPHEDARPQPSRAPRSHCHRPINPHPSYLAAVGQTTPRRCACEAKWVARRNARESATREIRQAWTRRRRSRPRPARTSRSSPSQARRCSSRRRGAETRSRAAAGVSPGAASSTTRSSWEASRGAASLASAPRRRTWACW